MMNQFERLVLQIGEKNVEKIKNTSVAIIGIGGVGGYALESIVRSGIGIITIIDNDTIDITNLNRQLITTHDNVEISKNLLSLYDDKILIFIF